MTSQHEMVGKVFPTNNGGDCVVVNYISAKNVTIMFLDEHQHQKKTQAVHVREGRVLNPFSKTVYEVGFIGVGRHKVSVKGKDTKIYKDWASMLSRGYSQLYKDKYPTYEECTVCEDWHNFQVFAEWAVQQEFFGSGYQIDKDILVRGNKLYSPNTCCYVPQHINKMVLAKGKTNKKAKESLIRGTAIEWKGRIDEVVFEALITWNLG